MNNHKFLALAAAFSMFFAVSCDEKDNPEGNEGSKGDDVEDIKVVDGMVKFYVSIDEASPRARMGITSRLTKVTVGGKDYTVQKDTDGRSYVQVAEAASGTYDAIYCNTLSKNFYGTSANTNVKIPYSQFHLVTSTSLQDYPMYASYSKETGNKLVFKDGFALLDLSLTGSETIKSVNVKNLTGAMMAGFANYKPSNGQFSMAKGVSYAELNCTRGGDNVALSASAAKHFYVMMAPASYSKGLQITVCDGDCRMMQFTTDPVTLAGNEVLSITKEYKPADDLMFYEGFDTFVWGGDYVGGQSVPAFAPTSETVTYDSGADLLGTEDAYASTTYDNPGTGFIQSNTWSDCQTTVDSPKTVATSHRMTESYVKSRGIGYMTNLFRCQERPGYVEVGCATTARGILQTGKALNIPEVATVNMEFDVCLKENFNDVITAQIIDGGYVSGCSVDGNTVPVSELSRTYSCASSSIKIPLKYFTIPASAAVSKSWNHVCITIDRATSGMRMYLTSASSSSGNHGFYVDNITITKVADMERGNLRVIDYNIQNGMWADQPNNYDNFVAWVKKYDPDVCVWCESVTIYKDYTGTGIGNSGSNYKGYLPNGWAALAARYGHKYVAIGGTRDNYPQVVTSKYPITTLEKITTTSNSSKPVAHGAGLHSITVNGRTIYIATLHTWPQSYAYGVSSSGQAASTAEHGGDYQRQWEMQYVIDQTKNNSKYASQKDWIFCGDFNSVSRLDNWSYGYESDNTKLLCEDVVLNNTDYQDVIAKKYPGDLMSSNSGTTRIDYMYLSPTLYADVKNAMMIIDDWTAITTSTYYTSFKNPSDHRPILVDLQL